MPEELVSQPAAQPAAPPPAPAPAEPTAPAAPAPDPGAPVEPSAAPATPEPSADPPVLTREEALRQKYEELYTQGDSKPTPPDPVISRLQSIEDRLSQNVPTTPAQPARDPWIEQLETALAGDSIEDIGKAIDARARAIAEEAAQKVPQPEFTPADVRDAITYQTAIVTFDQEQRALHPELAPLDKQIGAMREELLSQARNSGKIETVEDLIAATKVATERAITHFKGIAQQFAGKGKQDALSTREVVDTGQPLTPAGGRDANPAPQGPTWTADDHAASTRDALRRRQQWQQSRRVIQVPPS